MSGPQPPSNDGRPKVSRDHRRELAKQAFQSLFIKDRQILLMRWADDMSDQEIAAVYDNKLTVSEVGTLRRVASTRFRRRLRQLIAQTTPTTSTHA